MIVTGECLRFDFRDIDTDKIGYPTEIDVHLGPDEESIPLGRAALSERDGAIWASFTISDLDTKVLEENKYFAVALTENKDEGVMVITHLGLSTSNLDPNIKPVQTS